MRIRPVIDLDRPAIKLLHQNYGKHYQLPDFNNAFFEAVVVDEEDIIVGYAIIKLFLESTIVLNKDQSTFKQSKALKELHSNATRVAKQFDVSRLFAFTGDEDFEKILTSHLGFQECAGKTLFMELGNWDS